MRLNEEQKQMKTDAYIAEKTVRGLAWNTLEFDYMLKDLDADIWDKDGIELSEDYLDEREEFLATPANFAAFKYCPLCAAEGTVHLVEIAETVVTLRGEEYRVPNRYFECSRCKEFFMPKGGDYSVAKAREFYCEKHGLKSFPKR